ncbi:MAG: M48 family metalloprotease [Pseudomonadota bacterium]
MSASTGNASDFVGFIIFSGLIAIVAPPLFWQSSIVGIIVTCVIVGRYLYPTVIAPLRNSERVPQWDHRKGETQGYPVRISASEPTHVVDYFFGRTIVVNQSDYDDAAGTVRALIAHELAHIRNGDTRFFHFAGITGAISATSLFAIFALAMLYLVGDRTFFPEPPPDRFQPTILLMTAVVLTIIYFLFWLRDSLHEREFQADASALAMEPEAVEGWLWRSARLDRIKNRRPSRPTNAAIIKFFTHPTFAKRLKRISEPPRRSPWSFVAQSMMAFVMVPICGFLAYSLFQVGIIYGQAINSIQLYWAYFGFAFLAAAAAFTNFSVLVQRSLTAHGLGAAIVVSASFAASGWLLMMSSYGLSVVLGFYETITADLPKPPGGTTTGGWAWLSIIGSCSAVCLALNVALRPFLPRQFLAVLGHLIIGFLAMIGAFQVPRFFHWLF